MPFQLMPVSAYSLQNVLVEAMDWLYPQNKTCVRELYAHTRFFSNKNNQQQQMQVLIGQGLDMLKSLKL